MIRILLLYYVLFSVTVLNAVAPTLELWNRTSRQIYVTIGRAKSSRPRHDNLYQLMPNMRYTIHDQTLKDPNLAFKYGVPQVLISTERNPWCAEQVYSYDCYGLHSLFMHIKERTNYVVLQPQDIRFFDKVSASGYVVTDNISKSNIYPVLYPELPFSDLLFNAIMLHDKNKILVLLAANPGCVNKVVRDGLTPLHVAVFEGIPALVSMLVNNGAKVNCRMAEGITPLVITTWFDRDVATYEYYLISRILKDAGASNSWW